MALLWEHHTKLPLAAAAFVPLYRRRTINRSLKNERVAPNVHGAKPLHKLDIFQNVQPSSIGDQSVPRLWNKKLRRQLVGELIGTFLFVAIGTGSVMSAIYTDSLLGLFQIASVWIIAVTVAICCTASISGAHLNPAISISFAWLRPSNDFGWSKVLPYTVAQLAGAVLASCINFLLYSSTIHEFETAKGILRSSEAGIASAKAFGEYFL